MIGVAMDVNELIVIRNTFLAGSILSFFWMLLNPYLWEVLFSITITLLVIGSASAYKIRKIKIEEKYDKKNM